MHVAAKVVTGSRLHGLDTENSDTDYATVVVSPVREIISPFQTFKPKQVTNGDNDRIQYEFGHFIKLLTQGNATILEVVFSDHVENKTSTLWELVQYYKDDLMNKNHIYAAHKGYAHSQLAHVFKDGTSSVRGRKAAVAYIRVLQQGTDILRTGMMFYPLSHDLHQHLMLIKTGTLTPTGEEFQEFARPFEEELEKAYHLSELPEEVNYQTAEWLVEQAYLTPFISAETD